MNWTGNGADDLWSTPENWSSGALPTAADKFRITTQPGPTIVNEGAVGLDGWIGAGETGDLTMDGGTLTTSSFIVVARQASAQGTLNMISGDITAGGNLYVGHTGVGAVNMTGGTITTPTIVIPHNGTGHVNLDGGILSAGTLNMKQVAGTEIAGTMDVGAGTLNLDYDVSNAGKTTLTAIHNLNPFPSDRGGVGAGAVELS